MSHDHDRDGEHHHDEAPGTCEHLARPSKAKAKGKGCASCLAAGDSWVHLRLCLTCGHVGCCDQSKNRHATRHAWNERHEVVQSLEPGERWRWCYADALGVEE